MLWCRTLTEYRIVPATPEHARELGQTMRAGDVDEIWASGHFTPEEGLLASIKGTISPYAALADGRVICMFGTGQVSMLSDEGFPWCLTARELPNHTRAFLRVSRRYIAHTRPKYRRLLNFVDARNTIAVRWLKWLGFEVHPAEPFGIDQIPFHKFVMESD